MSDSQLNNSESLGGANNRPWIKSIHVDKIRHLEDFDIPICDDTAPRHLMITGPNGSGKTSLLLAIKSFIEKKIDGKHFFASNYTDRLKNYRKQLDEARKNSDENAIQRIQVKINNLDKEYQKFFGALKLKFHDDASFIKMEQERTFVISYYQDSRISHFKPVQTPRKPTLKFKIEENNGDQFIQFLVNLKIQQALAKNDDHNEEADEIEIWFDAFTGILKRVFSDDSLKLDFDYRDFSFEIVTSETRFPFTGLSAGYAAILDIVADMILRMQSLNRVTQVFEMPGIALIDEVETHLHLALQQNIMPILTTIFPKVQFIVSTHSPFVLNSISNATVYDLKNRKCVQNLTEYSYEALAEGYFGVETDSGELKTRLDTLETLIAKSPQTDNDKLLIKNLIQDFEKIPDGIAPSQKTRFYELKRQYLLAGGKR